MKAFKAFNAFLWALVTIFATIPFWCHQLRMIVMAEAPSGWYFTIEKFLRGLCTGQNLTSFIGLCLIVACIFAPLLFYVSITKGD